MTKTLALFLIAITLPAFGQETKQVKKEVDGDLEIYFVLKSDKKIKHGPYEKYLQYSNPMAKGNLLIERGQYDNNLMTGTWIYCWGENELTSKGNYDKGLKTGNWEYYRDKNVIEKGDYKNDQREGYWTYFVKSKGILERGYYKEGKKSGKWQYTYFGIPVQTFDHSADSILQSLNDSTETEIQIGTAQEVVKMKLQRSPQYVGHKRQMQTDMEKLTDYPLQARRMTVEGEVVLSFFVNEDGSISDFEILKDIGGGCGRAVIDAYNTNKVRWKPALFKNRKVVAKYYQSVKFELSIDQVTGLGRAVPKYD